MLRICDTILCDGFISFMASSSSHLRHESAPRFEPRGSPGSPGSASSAGVLSGISTGIGLNAGQIKAGASILWAISPYRVRMRFDFDLAFVEGSSARRGCIDAWFKRSKS